MEEGQISRWLKAEGDEIEANETIAEVDTDKATMEMTSLEPGTLLKILVPAGENAKLGQTIGIIGTAGEDFSALLDEAGATNGSGAASPKAEEKSAQTAPPPASTEQKQEVAETGGRSYDDQRPGAVQEAKSEAPKTEGGAGEGGSGRSEVGNGRMIVSPIAARMAAENGIDLTSVKGSGPQGRIIKRDIEAAMSGEQKAVGVEQTAQPATAPTFDTPEIQGASAFREENASRMRQVIAGRLAESIGPVPTFYLTVEIEMDNALEFRKTINASLKEEEKVSVNDVIVKVAAMASMKHPWVRSSWRGDKVRFYEDADVGVAVAIDEGLITPVVRGANRKGISEIAREVKELAARAREKRLQPEEYTGATFSISNLGMFGIKEFTAIINPPEAAILAVGGATPTPVVRNGEIVVRSIMQVTMSCDHRVIDGATGAKFLQTFKQMLENPILMLM
jgi:pyruvate dehydrogenase E2 component (dihydrolipoamide acetyltransferase)